MDILWGDVLQEHAVDLGSTVDIELHPWLRYDMLDIARDVLDPASVLNTQCLHGWRDCQTDRIFRPCGICYHKICGQGIQAAGNTFHGCIETLLEKPNSAFSE